MKLHDLPKTERPTLPFRSFLAIRSFLARRRFIIGGSEGWSEGGEKNSSPKALKI